MRVAGSDVMLLTGAGSAFCAGGDIAWMQERVDEPGACERVFARAGLSGATMAAIADEALDESDPACATEFGVG